MKEMEVDIVVFVSGHNVLSRPLRVVSFIRISNKTVLIKILNVNGERIESRFL